MRGRFMRQRFTVLLLTLTVAGTSLLVGCDLLNLFAFLGGAAAGAGTSPPDGAATAGPTLTSADPSTAPPGQIITLLGEDLTGTSLGGSPTLKIDDMAFPLLTVTDREVTVAVPPLSAGTYNISLSYPSGATNTLPLGISAPVGQQLPPTELAARWTANASAISTQIRDAVAQLQGLGMTSDTVFPEGIASVMNGTDALMRSIETDIGALSAEDAQLLDAMFLDSGLFETGSGSLAAKAQRAFRHQDVTLQNLFVSLDAAAMVCGNVKGLATGVCIVATIAAPFTGGGSAPIAGIAWKIRTWGGIVKQAIDSFPTDLYYVQHVDASKTPPSLSRFHFAPIEPLPSPQSDPIMIVVGETASLNAYGVFRSQDSLANLAIDLFTSDTGEDAVYTAIKNLRLFDLRDTFVRESVKRFSSLAVDAVNEGLDRGLDLSSIGAIWIDGVPVNMSLYNKKAQNIALDSAGQLFSSSGGIGPKMIGWAMKAVAKADLGPNATITPFRLENVAVASANISAETVTGQIPGTTQLHLTPVHFDTVETGNGVGDFFLSLFSITWIKAEEQARTVVITVTSPGGAAVCGNGICETGETNSNCPADCPATGTDIDGDGVPDSQDGCPNDPNKTSPGNCGCGQPETSGCGSHGGGLAELVGSLNTVGIVWDVAVSGTYAYLAVNGIPGFRVVDVSNPSAPQEVAVLNGSWNANGVFVKGNVAYVATDFHGLTIVDVSSPAAPSLLGSLDTGTSWDVEVFGNTAYVAGGFGGLHIIDVASPQNPSLLATYDPSGDSKGQQEGLVVRGNYVYLADGDAGLQIVDISNPNAPTKAGEYVTGFGDRVGDKWAHAVAVALPYAYVAHNVGYGTGRLLVLDVSNPASVGLVADVAVGSYAQGIAADGGYVYIADSSYGLKVIDISNPLTPSVVNSYQSPLGIIDVSLSGDFAYLADGTDGLTIVRVR